jgi:hypothetical protein
MQATEDTEMIQQDEESTVLSGADRNIGYVQSVGSQDLQSDDSNKMIEEEEQTITNHDFTNTIDEMDYTSTAVDDGFCPVQNGGSPNRTNSRQRQQEHSHNQFSALDNTNTDDTTTSPTTNTNNNIANGMINPNGANNNNHNDITSAKTDYRGGNE